jgi:hypothetical protein
MSRRRGASWTLAEAELFVSLVTAAEYTAVVSTTRTAAGLSQQDFRQVAMAVCAEIIDFESMSHRLGPGKSPDLLKAIYFGLRDSLHAAHCSGHALLEELNRRQWTVSKAATSPAAAPNPVQSEAIGTSNGDNGAAASANWLQSPGWGTHQMPQAVAVAAAAAAASTARGGARSSSSTAPVPKKARPRRRSRKSVPQRVFPALCENAPGIVLPTKRAGPRGNGGVDGSTNRAHSDASHPRKRMRDCFTRLMAYQGPHRFCCYEWLYSEVDYRGFYARNTFQDLLHALGIADVAIHLTRFEWQHIRRRLRLIAASSGASSSPSSLSSPSTTASSPSSSSSVSLQASLWPTATSAAAAATAFPATSACAGDFSGWPFAPGAAPRFGAGFLARERERLESTRTAARRVQLLADESGTNANRTDIQEACWRAGIRFEVPPAIPVGQRVTAVHPAHFLMATGTILMGLFHPSSSSSEAGAGAGGAGDNDGDHEDGVNADRHGRDTPYSMAPSYCVQFDNAELGVQLVPDFMVTPHGTCEVISGTDCEARADVAAAKTAVDRITYQDAETQKHASRLSAAAAEAVGLEWGGAGGVAAADVGVGTTAAGSGDGGRAGIMGDGLSGPRDNGSAIAALDSLANGSSSASAGGSGGGSSSSTSSSSSMNGTTSRSSSSGSSSSGSSSGSNGDRIDGLNAGDLAASGRNMAIAATAASAAAEALYRGGSRGMPLDSSTFQTLLALAAAAGAPGSTLSNGVAAEVLKTPRMM